MSKHCLLLAGLVVLSQVSLVIATARAQACRDCRAAGCVWKAGTELKSDLYCMFNNSLGEYLLVLFISAATIWCVCQFNNSLGEFLLVLLISAASIWCVCCLSTFFGPQFSSCWEQFKEGCSKRIKRDVLLKNMPGGNVTNVSVNVELEKPQLQSFA